MNVLSLFDGISCGQIALERAGIKVDKYYSSEIDKYAIQITQKNFPDTIQLGDIKKWKSWNIEQPDIIMGGSPCQGFSLAGKQLNFEDPRSKLFFEFVNILNYYKPKYFLLENVKMKKEFQNIISNYLRVEPIEINSSLVSAQNRKRLYWTNIPNITQPNKKQIKLSDILENLNFNREPYEEKYASNKTINYKTDKFNTLRANAGSRTRGIGICNDKGWWKKLTPVECERLQTLPDNYTEGISNTQRYKCIGNGWTIDVISHILKEIKYNQ